MKNMNTFDECFHMGLGSNFQTSLHFVIPRLYQTRKRTAKMIRILKVKVKIQLSLCFKWAPRHKDVLGSGGIVPRILDFGTRWRWVVSFTTRPIYLQGKSPRYPLDRRLGGPQNQSRRGISITAFLFPVRYLNSSPFVTKAWILILKARCVFPLQ
jgi:hypothetical protein